MNKSQSASDLLATSKVTVDPKTYYLVGLQHSEWERLLENPELGPSGSAPYMVLRDHRETTLLLEESDWKTLRHAARDAKVEGDFRLLAFDITLEWSVVGFLALVAGILAEEGIPVGALSAFSTDHILVKQGDLPRALLALGRQVSELC